MKILFVISMLLLLFVVWVGLSGLMIMVGQEICHHSDKTVGKVFGYLVGSAGVLGVTGMMVVLSFDVMSEVF